MYLLTRPLPKLEQSATAFADAGLPICVIALQDIVVTDNSDKAVTDWLQRHPKGTIIVTSAAAATVLQAIAGSVKQTHTVIAVGRSTAQLIQSFGLNVVIPETESSEGVLALPHLEDCASQDILLLKGQGGRTLLPEQLTAGGANLCVIDCYSRVTLSPPQYSRDCDWQHINGIIATSAEQAKSLINQFQTTVLLTQYPWLTVSERIATQLKQFGIERVSVCTKASDTSLIAWIQHNWE